MNKKQASRALARFMNDEEFKEAVAQNLLEQVYHHIREEEAGHR